MRLPRRLDFGLAVISVRLVTKAQMREADDTEDDEQPPDGLWDPESDAIYILRSLPNKQKREVYFHEIIHAVNDTDYWARYG